MAEYCSHGEKRDSCQFCADAEARQDKLRAEIERLREERDLTDAERDWLYAYGIVTLMPNEDGDIMAFRGAAPEVRTYLGGVETTSMGRGDTFEDAVWDLVDKMPHPGEED